MKVLVCGGRDYARKDVVTQFLDRLAKKHHDENGGETDEHGNWMPLPSFQVIHGGCNCGPHDPHIGADFFADQWCVCNWINPIVFEAEWNDIDHPDALVRTRRDGTKYDAKAGPRRNQRMIDEGKPDIVIAFPGGPGTADMVRRAKAAGVKVVEVPPPEQEA